MCTLIAIFGVREDYPLVLATNRDEFYARPATGAVRLVDDPASIGGRDLQAGGTWMGVTQAGFFVAVTNQPSFFERRTDLLSRGDLVLELLRLGDSAAVHSRLRATRPGAYNDFNLMFGDARGLWVGYGRAREEKVRVEAVPAGLHVLPNGELDSPEFPKCGRAADLLGPHLRAPWPQLERALRHTLADGHTVARAAPADAPAFLDDEMMRQLSALCVRTPVYGSRSSTVVALEAGRCAHYLYADGPPDRVAFEDVTALFGKR